mmetsp:Transcript_3678/g.4039  ORF Transcript_3678/g.4039 Transcript_3678/m.4039 type:complete len:202 (-) Transcript_3678:225-830(-)
MHPLKTALVRSHRSLPSMPLPSSHGLSSLIPRSRSDVEIDKNEDRDNGLSALYSPDLVHELGFVLSPLNHPSQAFAGPSTLHRISFHLVHEVAHQHSECSLYHRTAYLKQFGRSLPLPFDASVFEASSSSSLQSMAYLLQVILTKCNYRHSSACSQHVQSCSWSCCRSKDSSFSLHLRGSIGENTRSKKPWLRLHQACTEP